VQLLLFIFAIMFHLALGQGLCWDRIGIACLRCTGQSPIEMTVRMWTAITRCRFRNTDVRTTNLVQQSLNAITVDAFIWNAVSPLTRYCAALPDC
jgi:hypothetical protein